jgi:Holliday junction resolvase
MSTASRGRAFEYEIRQLFERAGFSVMRGAASKGFFLREKVDLIASRETRDNKNVVTMIVVGIQCKAKGK